MDTRTVTKGESIIVETKDEFPMMVEALFIKLLSDEDAAFQSMYRRFVRNYEKYEMVVLDFDEIFFEK